MKKPMKIQTWQKTNFGFQKGVSLGFSCIFCIILSCRINLLQTNTFPMFNVSKQWTKISILTSSDPTSQSDNGLFGYGHNSMMICKLVPICTTFILTIVGHKCTILSSKWLVVVVTLTNSIQASYLPWPFIQP